ncbi:hypothetical protein B0P06_001363 [Clostridium saccharoperbutylacetonicum]|uniref:Phage protein n=1 Tax=Clostridium saccharoperbutylacetonicum N1-4(HMT) TaxID=931276 RepID=M1MDU8_9CLOT|nr:DUF2577 domain-containing protein [Clostridium saccharoperbutylacetonicum]AGF54563.1 phage protein [Clostridium saccharoperbutylacetonicum N1-4(HMT)]NRT58916.1 hypothetical protein [Clostridium saccharoperbutylacetonicum]NSB28105.1 hypothetical protein [Clostridium saccharoperbutylacetonicum]NSB41592.1 hypothetical protein [Clostridium saccharoperbutylacetonicum]
MLELIKQASVNAINASNPLDIEFGTVTDAENITIKISQKKILPKEFFVVPESLTRYEVNLKNSKVVDGTSESDKLVIREGLKIDDTVILLKIESGARYLILDKVVK